MKSMLSGSYSALNSQEQDLSPTNVYRSTTRPSVDSGIPQRKNEKFNVVDSMKRIFRSPNYDRSGALTSSQSVFVLPNVHDQSNMPQVDFTGITRDKYNRRDKQRRMPTSMEEAALLGPIGCNPSESMDEVELKNIQLSFPSTRTLARGDSMSMEERVETNYGTVTVGIQGDRSKPAILTYHDLGLNYVSNFQAFFNFVDMRLLLQNSCLGRKAVQDTNHYRVYHVNAPGQEENAPTLSDSYTYPTMDELGDQILDVLVHFDLKRVIGFGVGVGANILCRFALKYPERVDALCVLNCFSTQAGWIEWGYQKLNARNLKSKGMTQGVLDYLMWHHFGKVTEERNHDLVYVYYQYFQNSVNPTNLGMFIDSYIRRTDLNIVRELDPIRKKTTRTLKMAVLNVTGALSPHVDDTVTFNGRLDPENSTWMKIQDCGMVMEEQPAKLSEAFRLFLQGQGYVPYLNSKRIALNRKVSVDSGVSGAGSSVGSSASLNNGNASTSSGVITPKGGGDNSLSSPLINLASSSSGLEKAVNDIHITENPISESPELNDSDGVRC